MIFHKVMQMDTDTWSDYQAQALHHLMQFKQVYRRKRHLQEQQQQQYHPFMPPAPHHQQFVLCNEHDDDNDDDDDAIWAQLVSESKLL